MRELSGTFPPRPWLIEGLARSVEEEELPSGVAAQL